MVCLSRSLEVAGAGEQTVPDLEGGKRSGRSGPPNPWGSHSIYVKYVIRLFTVGVLFSLNEVPHKQR